jgi:flagellar L-ring protein precursor FlgH
MNLSRHRPTPLPLVFFGINAAGCLLLLVVLLLTACAAGPIPEGRLPPPAVTAAPEDVSTASEGSLYRPYQGLSLFEDPKARQRGDLLTVLLVEKTQASKSTTTSTSKSTSAELGDLRVFGQGLNFDTGISGGTSFDGSGASAQSNKLEGSLTVTVQERYPNGVLRIAGEKRLRLNQGEETVRLEGLVRAADVTPANTITSDRIAEAGRGLGQRGQERRLAAGELAGRLAEIGP